ASVAVPGQCGPPLIHPCGGGQMAPVGAFAADQAGDLGPQPEQSTDDEVHCALGGKEMCAPGFAAHRREQFVPDGALRAGKHRTPDQRVPVADAEDSLDRALMDMAILLVLNIAPNG